MALNTRTKGVSLFVLYLVSVNHCRVGSESQHYSISDSSCIMLTGRLFSY